MNIRKMVGTVVTTVGLAWLVIFGGVIVEVKAARARERRSMTAGEWAKYPAFPFLELAADLRGFDLFREGPVSEAHYVRTDALRQVGIAGILIAIGLIAVVGPLREPLSKHRQHRFVLYGCIGLLGGGVAWFARSAEGLIYLWGR